MEGHVVLSEEGLGLRLQGFGLASTCFSLLLTSVSGQLPPKLVCLFSRGLPVNHPTTSGTYHFTRTDTISIVAVLGRELNFPTNGLPEARGMAGTVSFHSLASQQGMTS